MDKPTLIKKIKVLESLTNEEKTELIHLPNSTKKYGLVWEDKPENVERDLLTKLPILQEVPERRILAKSISTSLSSTLTSHTQDPSIFDESEAANEEVMPSSKVEVLNEAIIQAEAPNHILIEGDNLHALTALTFTHEGKIDLMYFDPPYNTGNKDFKYNDYFVDKEDSYRHSKWLSFMHKRLLIAKRLLSEKGVLFISIDNNEQAQLKLFCDELFGENAFLGMIIWKNVTDNNPTNIANEHEYILCYAKNKANISPVWKSTRSYAKEILLEIEKELLSKNQTEELLVKEFKKWFKENKKFLGELDRYKYIDLDGIYTGSQSVHNPGKEGYRYNVIHPITGKPCKEPLMGYRFPEPTMRKLIEEGRILYGDDHEKIIELKVYAKEYLSKLSSLIELDGRLGANELRAIFHEKSKVFNNPKPVELISQILSYASPKDSVVLDIFAGSGTTLHAIMELNSEDGGKRQCILATNNENNICDEVTYERNKRVIQGYTSSKGVQLPGIYNNNLRYYKTGFVPSAKTEVNRRLLTTASTELLQIKEDCYNDITPAKGFDPAKCCICTNGTGKYLLIVYHSRKQHEVISQLCEFIENIPDLAEKVRVYAFSTETEVLLEDFNPVANKVNAVPLPDAIYNAYRAIFKTLKLEKKTFTSEAPEINEEGSMEASTSEDQPELFELNEEV